MREVDVPSHTGLVVGDGAADLALAQELGCPFVFLGEMSEWAGAEAALGFHNETVVVGGTRYIGCYDYTNRTIWLTSL